jgi:O-antigen/teichoic acid export membrane protein
MMIQVIDRPLLKAMTDEATVGVYQVNHRLGIFMMLIVSMYDFAWRPFFLSHAQDADAKQLFARVLTYFVLMMAAVLLTLSFLIPDVVKWPVFWGYSIVPEPYWYGLSIVPVILLAYVFLGVSNNLVAGIYIQKKTGRLPVMAFVGAGTNVLANLLLIPALGIMGAALALLLSYAAMAILVYVLVQKIYPIRYEWERIAKIVVSALIVFLLWLLVPAGPLELVWEIALLVLFGLLMYWMRFFSPSELAGLRLMLAVRRGRKPGVEPPQSGDL